MSKKEQLAKETKLQELESTVVSNFSINNGSLFRAAETLLVIKKGDLFKAVKKDGKMAYRTFKSYLDHFELNNTNRKLIEKLIAFNECLVENKLEASVTRFPDNDEFWTLFMKVKPENWAETVEIVSEYRGEIRVEDIEAVLKAHPSYKVGYCADRKLPTPVQNIIANAKKLDNNSLAELILRGTDEEAFDKLYELMRKAKESLDDVAIVSVDNKLIAEDNDFAVVRMGSESKATKFVHKKASSTAILSTMVGFMAAGYIIGRFIEYGIHKLLFP